MRLVVAAERKCVVAETEGCHGPGPRSGGVATPAPGAIEGDGGGGEIPFAQGLTPGFESLSRGAVACLEGGQIAAAAGARLDGFIERAFAGGAIVHSDPR